MASFTQPATPAQQLHGAVVSIAVARIKPSPTNPRKIFEGIEGLADSIKEVGLLQNLVVRPDGKAGDYVLIAGERRWRALKLARIERAPCNVQDVDADDAMAEQIVENLQRADLGPLEEAEQFKALQDHNAEKWTVQAIAKKVGKTDRFVQQRIAIARNLSPKLKKRFGGGELNVECARLLAAVPAALQDKVGDGWGSRNNNARQLKSDLDRHIVPVGAARFDVATYKGPMVEDDGKRYFADVAEFQKLQAGAAQSVVDKLRADGWANARLLNDSNDVSDFYWADTMDRVSSYETKAKATGRCKVAALADKQTAIVWLDRDRKLRQALGVVPAAIASKHRPKSSGHGMPDRETADQRRHRHAYNAAVFAAVGAKPDLAFRLLLLRFIDGTTRCTYDHSEAKRAHEANLPATLVPFAQGYMDGAKRTKAWALIKAMKAADVATAIAKYTALSLSWSTSSGKAPNAFTVAIAREAKAKLPTKAATAKGKPKAKAKPATKKKAAKKKGGRK